jgi:hypothetical protein
MEIGIEYRLEKVVAAGKEAREVRPQMTHINIQNGMAVATDGVTVACAPVEMVEGDTEGYLSTDALLLARKDAKQAESYYAAIKLDDVQTLDNGITIPRPIEVDLFKFPNTDSVIEPARQNPTISIGINPRRLVKLADAIGSGEGVVLHIRKSTDTILVTPSAISNKAFGAISLMRISEEDADELAGASDPDGDKEGEDEL